MIKPGSYFYIRGTNIEVGVRRVSHDPANPYAQCTFRYGKRKNNNRKSKTPAIKMVVQKIPFDCLSKEPAFDKRGKLKKSFIPCEPCSKEAPFIKVTQGNVYSASVYYYIWGIDTLALPFKSFDHDTGVITFKTNPIRKAHISVLRTVCTLPDLQGHSQRWEQSWAVESLLHDPTPVELGCIYGTNIAVSNFIPDEISLYKITEEMSVWIPNTLITTRLCSFDDALAEDLTPTGPVYVHGLPIKFTAYKGADDYVFVGIKGNYWKVKKTYITRAPSETYAFLQFHRGEERVKYMQDYRRRRNELAKYLPVAVK